MRFTDPYDCHSSFSCVYLILYTRGCKKCEGEGKVSYTVVAMREAVNNARGRGSTIQLSKHQDFEELIFVC